METEPKAYVIFSGQVVEPCATLEEAQAIAADMRAFWTHAPQSERDNLGWQDCSVAAVLAEIDSIRATVT
jgi:hypothetical protein